MKATTSTSFGLAALCAVALPSGIFAQGFTAADSGWVRIFNGNNFDGLYSRHYGAAIQRPPHSVWQIENAGTDTAAIRVSGTSCPSQCGHLGTDKTSYKHYRVRVQYRFDVANGNNNAGLTYHTDESAPRMQNNWPRSIESQMKQSETGSAFSIQQVAFTTRTSSGTGQGSSYSDTGSNIVQACETGCNGRWYRGAPLVGTHPSWIQKEVVVRGADSALHIINGTTVMRLWNIRLVDNSGQTLAPWDSGALAVQSEGALIRYRRWEIMEFPASTPMSAHYLHRLLLDTASKYYNSGTQDTIRWRSIGAIPFVKIEYRLTSPEGTWKTVTDSAPNTGFYAWHVPSESGLLAKAVSPALGSMRIRISGPDYVRGDSINAGVVIGTSISKYEFRGNLSFSIPGRGAVLANLASGSKIEIRDAGGSLVRALTLDGNLSWDMLDARGARVPPGMYFLRALHDGVAYRAGKALVF